MKVSDLGKIPVALENVVNITKAWRKKEPAPRPEAYLDAIHMDVGYRYCKAMGGYYDVVLLVDRTSHMSWVYDLTSLSQDPIIVAL